MIYLGKELLELTIRLEGKQVVATTNVLLGNKDIGNGSLTSLLLEIILDSGAIVFLVELDDIELGGESLDGFLCATAVSCKTVNESDAKCFVSINVDAITYGSRIC